MRVYEGSWTTFGVDVACARRSSSQVGRTDRARREWASAAATLVSAVLVGCDGQITNVDVPPGLASPAARQPGSGDPLLALEEFTSQVTCSGCHPEQAAQWRVSAHSHAMTDVAFRALVSRASVEDPEVRAFCLSCHSNIGTTTGRVGAPLSFEAFEPIVMEGVTCESCHRITSVFRPSNAGHVLDPRAPMQGSAHSGDSSPYHRTERSGVLGTAELCGSCHDVEGAGGLALEQPFAEWSAGPARAEGKSCVDCHMPPAGYGPAAQGFDLPPRPLRSHTFLGPGVLTALAELDEARRDDLLAQVQAQLRSAVSIEVEAATGLQSDGRVGLRIFVESHVSGHRFPTGSVFFRRVWLHVQVSDRAGTVVFETAHPEVGVDPLSSEQERLLLSARLFDAFGEPTTLPWRAKTIDNTNALQPLESRSIDLWFEVPPSTRGPLYARVSLQFQTLSDALLQELELPQDTAATIEIDTARCEIMADSRAR